MRRCRCGSILWVVFSLLSFPAAGAGSGYDELAALFREWREFQRPVRNADGVPDYSVEAMAAQHRKLADYRARLEALDASGWSISQRIDLHLARAEMSGLDFDHRVLRPWARDPAFYVTIFNDQSDTPAHEGPVIDHFIDLWTFHYPLDEAEAADLAGRIGQIPATLRQARVNLTGDARDLWVAGIRSVKGQSADLEALANRTGDSHAGLTAAIAEARQATDAFAAWLESEAPKKNGPSGVGKDNYTWYLREVHLSPYSWEEEVFLMRRELARAHASLRLEEHRNRDLPRLGRVADAEEYDRRFNQAVTEYVKFLRDEEILPVRDFMDQALRERVGNFTPATGLRNFFSEVSYRDPIVMRTHDTHWIDLARMQKEPHSSPVRRGPLLYNIFDGRAEGLATGMEEMMMRAGLFKDSPRSRELIWILLAQRAARALGGLLQHGGEWNIEEAAAFTSRWTPRGWLPPESDLMLFEQQLYLRQPGYGSSYVTGKVQIEALMAERALDLGDDFTLSRFLEEVMAAGVIPVSMIRWELTGRDDQIRGMLGASGEER